MPHNALHNALSRGERRLRVLLGASSTRPRKRKKYLKGVYRGNFVRIPLPDKAKKKLPDLPKLRSPVSPPKPFKNPPEEVVIKQVMEQTSTEGTASSRRTNSKKFFKAARAWWKQNWSVVVLNFGSVCSLVGFTRSDVLELRGLSMVGSICAMVYNMPFRPRRWSPIVWSAMFAVVNGTKIAQIYEERRGTVVLDEKQENTYVEFFMDHGLTPKQFEVLYSKAERVVKKKGELVVRQGEELKDVYLVTEGSTRASVLGRHLTAASSAPHRKSKVGGDSGAWIGEMAFLENCFAKDAAKSAPDALVVAAGTNKDDGKAQARELLARKSTPEENPRMSNAIYTIVAAEPLVLLRWSHKDMAEIMDRSPDFRSAMTRAMTAAIVGKVINFTVHRGKAMPTWSTWLDDWNHSAAGSSINVQDDQDDDEEEEEEEDAPNDQGGGNQLELQLSLPKGNR